MIRKNRMVHRFQSNRKTWKPTISGQNYGADIKNKPVSQPAIFVFKSGYFWLDLRRSLGFDQKNLLWGCILQVHKISIELLINCDGHALNES